MIKLDVEITAGKIGVPFGHIIVIVLKSCWVIVFLITFFLATTSPPIDYPDIHPLENEITEATPASNSAYVAITVSARPRPTDSQ
jgi:hypothetical protein